MPLIDRPSCEICGNHEVASVVKINYNDPPLRGMVSERYLGKITPDDLANTQYEIMRCDKCDFLFQKMVPDDQFAQNLYTYESSRINKSLNKKKEAPIEYYARYALIAEKISIFLNKKPSEVKVLDFGSGWGYFLMMARAHGFETTGIEISAERVAYSRGNGLNIFENLNELGEKFDFIYSDQTFEHINSPIKYLRLLVERLSEGGILYISVPDCSGSLMKIQKSPTKITHELYPLEHINGFTNFSLKKLAEKAGLKPLDSIKMSTKLCKRARLFHNGHFLQEGLKTPYLQKFKTDLYFTKSTNKT